MIKRIAIGVLLALLAFYIVDYALASSRPMGSFQVKPYYAIHQKNGKIEFDYSAPPQMESCVASVLPHMGSNPCWYVQKHKLKRIEV